MLNTRDQKPEPPLHCSDQGTIEYLYKKMAKAAVAKTASIVGRQDVAAEIAHDTFIKLWESQIIFPSEKAVYVWVYKTCHRAAIDVLRSASRRYEISIGEDMDQIVTPASLYGDVVMTRDAIQAAIRSLKPDEAEAFLYMALDGMTQVEIADVMGLSRRTVQRLLEKVESKLEEMRRREIR